MIKNFIDNKILPFVFELSSEPMRYMELLKANQIYNDGLDLEGKIPGMRLKIGKNLLVFAIMWNILVVVVSLILHKVLAKIDCHLLIILSVLFTAVFFAAYSIYKSYILRTMAYNLITKAWKNHYPHFHYEAHAKEVSRLYKNAIEQEIPHKEIQLYILDHLIEK